MTKEDALNVLKKYGAIAYTSVLDEKIYICIDGFWIYYLYDNRMEVDDVIIHHEVLIRTGKLRIFKFNEEFEKNLNEYLKKLKKLKLEIRKMKVEKDFNGAE